jgi:hypothetical protein
MNSLIRDIGKVSQETKGPVGQPPEGPLPNFD